MALIAAGSLSRNAAFIDCVKFVAFNGKSLLRPHSKVFAVPSATIVSKIYQDPDFLSKPWPYKEKGYNLFHYLFDGTQKRFNENTKIIVVDGPEAVGKSTLAKQIAEDLNMKFYSEPDCDQLYTNEYGFNLRELNSQLPPNARFINKEDFYREPTLRLGHMWHAGLFQWSFLHYLDAMAHVLNTGQGVVLERSFFSDRVIMESLVACGYLRPEYVKYYYDTVFIVKRFLLQPHLVIYLDIPVEKVQERIKKRGIDYELNTPALSIKYLTEMEKHYKQKYLPEITVHSELLVYDWSNFGDAEVVVEDIELIDFDKYDKYDAKLQDWRIDRERQWGMYRMTCTSDKCRLMNMFNQFHSHIPEMFMSGDDWHEQMRVVMSHKTEKYAVGYNTECGDKGIAFKLRRKGYKFDGVAG